MKNTLGGIKGRIIETEQISKLEDRMVKITSMEQNKEGMKRSEDNIEHTKIWIIGVPKEEKKEKGSEKISEEIIVENFL